MYDGVYNVIRIKFIRSGVFFSWLLNTAFVLITYFIKIHIILSLNRILYNFRGHKNKFYCCRVFSIYIYEKFLLSCTLCKWKTNLCDLNVASLLQALRIWYFHIINAWIKSSNGSNFSARSFLLYVVRRNALYTTIYVNTTCVLLFMYVFMFTE